MLCLITRLRVRKRLTFLWVLVEFVRIRRAARNVPGLIDSGIAVKPRRTVYLVSLWENEKAILDFNRMVPRHTLMVRWMGRQGAEVWSGYFVFSSATEGSRPWWPMPSHVPPGQRVQTKTANIG
jgi:hypothetical protein